MTDQNREILVLVEATVATSKSVGADAESIQGLYEVYLNGGVVGPQNLASAALDVFHEEVAIDAPEDVELTVFDRHGQRLDEPAGTDSYDYSGWGEVAGRVASDLESFFARRSA